MTAVISLMVPELPESAQGVTPRRSVDVDVVPELAHVIQRADAARGRQAGEQRLSIALAHRSAIEERDQPRVLPGADEATEALLQRDGSARYRVLRERIAALG